jgi:negative regulator of flagellin synthesis FlgM
MVDSIGWKATRPATRATAVMPTPPVRPVSTPASASVETSGVARQLAATPPVDLERVTRIKKAIADGSFPVVSSTIADRLLALKLEWNPNEQA